MPQPKHPPTQKSYAKQFQHIQHNIKPLPHTRTRTIVEDENGDFFLRDDSGQLHCLTGAAPPNHAPLQKHPLAYPRPATTCPPSPKGPGTSDSDTSHTSEVRLPTSSLDKIPPLGDDDDDNSENDNGNDNGTDSESDSGFTVVASPHSFSGAKELEDSNCQPKLRKVPLDGSQPLQRREVTVEKEELELQFRNLQCARNALDREERELQQESYPNPDISNGGIYKYKESTIRKGNGGYHGLGTTRDFVEEPKDDDCSKTPMNSTRTPASSEPKDPDHTPLVSSHTIPSGEGGDIHAGYLYVVGKNRRWKKKEFRCDDRFLVCLSDELYVPHDDSLPFLGTFRQFAITTHVDTKVDMDSTVRTLSHALFATPGDQSVRYYQKPKYVVRLSDVRRITLIARHRKILDRCFVLHASDRKYILQAESKEEQNRWLLLLVQRARRNAGERERNEMDGILNAMDGGEDMGDHPGLGIEAEHSTQAVEVPILATTSEGQPQPIRVPSPQLGLGTIPTLQYAKPHSVESNTSRGSISTQPVSTDLETLTTTYRSQLLSRSYFLLNELGCASGFIPVVPASLPWYPALSESYIPVLMALQHLWEVVREFQDGLSSCREPDARYWEATVSKASENVRNKVRLVVGEGGLLANARLRMEARDSVEELIDVLKVDSFSIDTL